MTIDLTSRQQRSRHPNPGIALLFEQLAALGGDHCHRLTRMLAPLCREVLLVDGSLRIIPESNWPLFSGNQVEMQVQDGVDRAKAEAFYAEKGKAR